MSGTADELRGLVEDLRHEALHTYSLSLRALLRNAADAIDGMLARLTAAEAELAFLKSEAQADADIAAGNFGMEGTIDDLRRLRELGERS